MTLETWLKGDVSTRLATRCSGCGITYTIELISEPILFKDETSILKQIKAALHELYAHESNCPICKQKTKSIHRWDYR